MAQVPPAGTSANLSLNVNVLMTPQSRRRVWGVPAEWSETKPNARITEGLLGETWIVLLELFEFFFFISTSLVFFFFFKQVFSFSRFCLRERHFLAVNALETSFV